MKRALVTGATGFVGSHLAESLVERGFEVRCLVRHTSDLRWVEKLPISLVYGDVSDSESLVEAVKEVDYIFHFAGLLKARDIGDYTRVNAKGTANLLEACAKSARRCKRFIYCSSQAAAGPAINSTPLSESALPNPISAYGKSKLEGEMEVQKRASDFPYTIVRPPAVYGPKDMNTLLFFRMIRAHIAPIMGRKERQFSMVFVKDLVEAVITSALSDRAERKTYFVSDGQAHTWEEVSSEIASALGNVKILKVPLPNFAVAIASFLAQAYSHANKKPVILSKDKLKEINQRFWLCDDSAIRGDLNYKEKYSLSHGMAETVRWYRERGWLR